MLHTEAIATVREMLENDQHERHLLPKQRKALRILLGDEKAKLPEDVTKVRVVCTDLKTKKESVTSVATAAQLLQCSVAVLQPGAERPIEYYQAQLLDGHLVSTPYRTYKRKED